MKRGLKAFVSNMGGMFTCGYNRFPDEKGTESTKEDTHAWRTKTVTIVSPMKRGLKAFLNLSNSLFILVTIVSPMKRGLKDPIAR